MLTYSAPPQTEAFTPESRMLRFLSTNPKSAAALVKTPDFSLILDAFAFETPQRPFSISFILYSLLFHEESRNLLNASQKEKIRGMLKEIAEYRRVDASYKFAKLGLRALNPESDSSIPAPQKKTKKSRRLPWLTLLSEMIPPLDIYSFEADHSIRPNWFTVPLFAAPWGFARWLRITGAQNLTAIFWQPWSQLMVQKVAETVVGVELLASVGFVSAPQKKKKKKKVPFFWGGGGYFCFSFLVDSLWLLLEQASGLIRSWSRGALENSSPAARTASLAASGSLIALGSTFLIWRIPFTLAPIMLSSVFDTVQALTKTAAPVVNETMHDYLDRKPIVDALFASNAKYQNAEWTPTSNK